MGKKMGMEKKEREREREKETMKEGRKEEGGKGSRENSIDQGLEVNFHN